MTRSAPTVHAPVLMRRPAVQAVLAGHRPSWQRLTFVSGLSYGALLAAITGRSLTLNGGRLVYTLDDPYIHLAMVRAWEQWRTIGVSKDHFAMASSSPLWTVGLGLLSGLFGLGEWLPYAMNVASCLLLVGA